MCHQCVEVLTHTEAVTLTDAVWHNKRLHSIEHIGLEVFTEEKRVSKFSRDFCFFISKIRLYKLSCVFGVLD